MSQLAMSAVGSALSLLGNINESERSQTQSAISANIDLEITDNEKQMALTGKTVEETLQSLNKDVANANQKVNKQDLSKAQERQEMAQVIGELSQAGINHLVGKHLKEAEAKRKEAKAIEKENPAKAAELNAQAKAIEAEYGLGSNLQMGIRAATAALQGLATGSVEQAAVGAASPYLNKLIKNQTGDNKEANLIAHAVLGAVEAHITGNNVAAGAMGALTAEVAAPLIMQTLYGVDNPTNLSENQKQNVANLSQIAAGLSGGLVGDSTASGIFSAETGKRAVENNLLSREKDDYLFEKSKEFNEKGKLMEKDKEKTKAHLLEGAYIDALIKVYQEDPSKLNDAQKYYLHSELTKISTSYDIDVNTLYNWDFSRTLKRDDSKLSRYLALDEKAKYSYERRQAESLNTGLAMLPLAYGADKAVGFIPNLAKTVASHPVKSEAAVVFGYGLGKQTRNGEYDFEGLGKDVGKTLALGKLSLGKQVMYGTAMDFVYEVNKQGATEQSIRTEMLGNGSGYIVSGMSENISKLEPKFGGFGKIIIDTIGGSEFSDYIKEQYKNVQDSKDKDK